MSGEGFKRVGRLLMPKTGAVGTRDTLNRKEGNGTSFSPVGCIISVASDEPLDLSASHDTYHNGGGR